MSYSSLLIHTCDVLRNTPGVADAYGHPTPSWAVYLPNQACRLTASSGREIKVGLEVVVADYKLFVEDIDITEQDRVAISGVTYEVLLVQGYSDDTTSHHKQCWLRIVR